MVRMKTCQKIPQKNFQTTLDGEGQIVLTKTGAPMCTKCGHYLTDDSHPDDDGIFHNTIWCDCDCYIKYDRRGNPKQSFEIHLYKKLGLVR